MQIFYWRNRILSREKTKRQKNKTKILQLSLQAEQAEWNGSANLSSKQMLNVTWTSTNQQTNQSTSVLSMFLFVSLSLILYKYYTPIQKSYVLQRLTASKVYIVSQPTPLIVTRHCVNVEQQTKKGASTIIILSQSHPGHTEQQQQGPNVDNFNKTPKPSRSSLVSLVSLGLRKTKWSKWRPARGNGQEKGGRMGGKIVSV